jgi:chromosome segregation ATPase
LEKINGELDLARKKKQVLDKLLSDGKVSQPTYTSFTDEIADAITEIELKQKALADKMKTKTDELEQQLKTLEHLLVNSEIRHVAGETDDDTYDHECSILSLGLDTTRRELTDIRDAITHLSDPAAEVDATPEPPPPEALAPETADPPAPEPEPEAEAEAEAEPEPEKRLEIIVDSEETTTIESTVEEHAPEDPPSEEPTDAAADPDAPTDEEPTPNPDEPIRVEIAVDDPEDQSDQS